MLTNFEENEMEILSRLNPHEYVLVLTGKLLSQLSNMYTAHCGQKP